MKDDQAAFAALYHQFSERIYRFLVWRTGDGGLADDLVSETFLRGWQSFDQFDGQHAQAWLFRIARNLLTDHWRKKRELPLDDAIERTNEPGVVQATHERIDQTAEFQRLHRAISQLGEPHQSVVILRFFEELPAAEVATALNLTEANVRVIQFRALKQLKGMLKKVDR